MAHPDLVRNPARLGEALAADAYVRSRLHPRRRQGDYLILRDILTLLGPFAGDVRGRLFDFGSGGAPYRALFTGVTDYVRADVTPGPLVDRLLATTPCSRPRCWSMWPIPRCTSRNAGGCCVRTGGCC
mgnify:CR=1 FL=1